MMEKAVLIGLQTPKAQWDIVETMGELAKLAETAGAQTVAEMVQKRPSADSAYYVGKGKAEEIAVIAAELEADLALFDDELSPDADKKPGKTHRYPCCGPYSTDS
jgi:GTPase